jgi:hypothetical protein
MTEILRDVAALRWHLPVRTPSDHRTELSGDQQSMAAASSVAEAHPLERPLVARALPGPSGDNADPQAAPIPTHMFPDLKVSIGTWDGQQMVRAAGQDCSAT